MKITFTEILFIDNKLFKKIFIVFFISFIILFSNDFVFAHGGEDHGEHKEKQDTQSTSKNIDLGFIKTEKIINNKNGAFKIIFEQRPKIIYQGDRANFTFHVLEIIENSFIEPENIELKNINVSNDRLLNINIKKNVNNFYSFDLVFDKNANLELNIIDINNNKLKYNFNIDIVKLPINYTFYTLIIIILITLIIYTICFIRKSNSFSQKIVIISLNIIMLIISVILISYLLPLRIKHPIQVSKELNQNIKINTNDVFVNKETQLLFDIKTQTIHKKNVSDSINIFGTIKPFSQDRGDIISPVSGRVYLNSLFLGQYVIKNQNLGYIEQTLNLPEQLAIKTSTLELKLKILELESKINNLNNKVSNSNKEYNRSKVDYNAKKLELNKKNENIRLNINLAQKEYLRVKELYKTGSASLRRLQESENNLNVFNNELESLKNQNIYNLGTESLKRLRESELQLKNDEQDLILAKNQLNELSKSSINTENKKFDLISPISGIITEINTTYGNQEEQNKLIINIVNNKKMLIEGDVLERDISIINESKIGEFTVNSYPSKVFKLDGIKNKFIALGNSIDSEKRTIPIMFEIDNKDNKFKEGMFANISLNISNKSKNIVIPKSSIFQDSGKYFVYIYKKPEIFEKRMIEIFNQNQEYVFISKGLDDGEKIAIQGIYQLNSLMIGKK